MKDPIPLTDEEIIENISIATLDFCRELEIPEYAMEEFKSFPLPARFIVIVLVFDNISIVQQEEYPKKSIINREKALHSLLIMRLLCGEKSQLLQKNYLGYWTQKAQKWWNSFEFKENCH